MNTQKITTYQHLLDALSQMDSSQLQQPILSTACNPEYVHTNVTEIEVQDYDFLQHVADEDDFGTIEELQATHGLSFKLENYKVAVAKGTVILN